MKSYTNMEITTREFIAENPSENRLLLIVALTNIFFILSWSIKAIVTPTAFATSLMGTNVVLWLLIAIMMRVTAIYGLSLGLGAICKLLGGTGTMHETRAGVFWGAFIAAPLGLAVAGLATFIAAFETSVPALGYEHIQMLPYWLSSVPFIWFIAKGAAVANKLDSAIPLFGIMSAIFVGFAIVTKILATGAL